MSSVAGYFDEIRSRIACGWAAQPGSDAPLTVQLLVDDTVVAEAIANEERADLLAAGVGSGRHGFSLEIPLLQLDGRPHAVAVLVAGTGDRLTSEITEFTLSADEISHRESPDLQDQASGYAGFVDTLTNDLLTGWALKRDSVAPLVVELIVDRVPTVETTADHFRRDVEAAGLGTGRCGFVLRIPSDARDGNPHSISVRLKGTEVTLPSKFYEYTSEEAAGSHPNVQPRKFVHPALPTTVTMSVIMPTYNRGPVMESTVERFLPCLAKAGAEMIIIDDGSKDDTPERLARLAAKSSALRYESVPNRGPGAARNRAASLAQGDILVLVGDDVAPVDDDFLLFHQAAHARYGKRGQAVVGKISWPDIKQLDVNFVMSHIQGEGEQQFGYRNMVPYNWYKWNLFYGSNISIKRNLVSNWHADGFNAAFYLAAFEDAEFALRTTERLELTNEKLEILYLPTASLVHHHRYDVESFIRRQVSVGLMSHEFLKLHPGREADLGLDALKERLDAPHTGSVFPVEHYLAVFEGLRSWAVVIENHYGLGSQNWHGDLLKTVFQLAFYEGYIRAQVNSSINLANGCRYVLEQVRVMLNRALMSEIIGVAPMFDLV